MLGIFFSAVLATAAIVLAPYIPAVGAVTLSIVLGLATGNALPVPDSWNKGIKWTEKHLLATAIALMGLGLKFENLAGLGWTALAGALLSVLVALSAAQLFRRSNTSAPLAGMLGFGNAICGSSAVAAVSPVLKGNSAQTGIAIGVVNLIGTAWMFLLPLLCHALGFEVRQAAVWIGGSLQAVGQAVAAGHLVNEPTGELATVVKMARVLMLGPAVITAGFLVNRQRRDAASSGIKMPAFPPFILVFVAMMILGNSGVLPAPVFQWGEKISDILLATAMAAIGLNIRFSSLKQQGPAALQLGLGIALVQLIVLGLWGYFMA